MLPHPHCAPAALLPLSYKNTQALLFPAFTTHCSLCLDHPLPSLAAAIFKSSLECHSRPPDHPTKRRAQPRAPGFCYGVPTPSSLARHSTYSSVSSSLPGLFSIFHRQTISSTSLGILTLVFFTKYPVSNHTPSTYQANHMNLVNNW